MGFKKRSLGRGLAELGVKALLDDLKQSVDTELEDEAASSTSLSASSAGLQQLDLDQLEPGQYQPRQQFDSHALQELADSIREQGIIQPIVVRPIVAPSVAAPSKDSAPSTQQQRYEIIAGERRWRAARLAGLTQLPALIRTMDDQAVLAISLVENIQRQSLNAVEKSEALQRLINQFQLTHHQAAQAIGQSRATVTNLLRLQLLAEPVKEELRQGRIEMGHARALLALSTDQQVTVAQEIVSRQLSVREAEGLIARLKSQEEMINAATEATVNEQQQARQQLFDSVKAKLKEKYHATVDIKSNAKSQGKIVLHYRSEAQLQTLLKQLLDEETEALLT